MPSLYQFSAWVFHVSCETVGGLWGPQPRAATSTFFTYASLLLMTLYGKILKFGTFKIIAFPTPRLQNSTSRLYSARSSAALIPRGKRRIKESAVTSGLLMTRLVVLEFLMMGLLIMVWIESLITAAGSMTLLSSLSSVILPLLRYASDSTTPLRMKLQNRCRNSQFGQAHSTVIWGFALHISRSCACIPPNPK